MRPDGDQSDSQSATEDTAGQSRSASWQSRWRALWQGSLSRLRAAVHGIQMRWRLTLGIVATVVALLLVLALWWSREPELVDVRAAAAERMDADDQALPVGFATAVAVEETARGLLHKRGGYLRHSRLPPALFMDNMPNWELGVVWHLREWSELLRRDISRADRRATEDPDLVIVEPQFYFDTDRWLLPSTVSEYRRGLRHLSAYVDRLQAGEAEFHVRSEDLARWLAAVDDRLDQLQQQLVYSVATRAYDPPEFLAIAAPQDNTPRLQIDDVIFQARGYSWALLHSLQGVQEDYAAVLGDDPVMAAAMEQALLELVALQRPIWAPWVMNGSGYGVRPNHALVSAAHLGRARNALLTLAAGLD